MLLKLIRNQWKENFRSPYWTQSLVQTIILGFFALYFALSLLAIGFLFDKIISEQFPGMDVIQKFNGLMAFYFLGDLFMRFFFQRFPALHIRPYLHLPIQRKQLIHYLLIRSIPSFFSWLPLFLILPFFFKVIIGAYTISAALAWLGFMLAMVFLNNFLAFYLSKSFGTKPLIALAILALAGGLFYLDIQKILPVSDTFAAWIQQVIDQPILILIPLAISGLVYWGLFNLLKRHAYIDEIGGNNNEVVSTMDFGLGSRFGKIGEEIELELKLIWRSARSRTFVYISIAFIFYPFILMGDEEFSVPLGMFVGLILTGAFMLNYAQLLLSWHSPHFDFILTQNISIRDFFLSRYYLLAISNVILLVLSLPYLFIIPQLGLINLAMFFYNTGVVIFIYMVLANFSSKRIDPDKGGVFNMEGFGGAHYLIMIPIMAIPILIYLPFNAFGYPNAGIGMICLLGVLGIVFRDRIIDAIVTHFKSRKHTIAAAFRKK